MLIKVGELAARTNQTVRTLHHYDAVGLLKPSARSDAGYRLYKPQDVVRLHAILALRQCGIPLSEIAQALSGEALDMPGIVAQQINSLEQQMMQSALLLSRLVLLQSQLAQGVTPHLDDWLATLARMGCYNKHFSPAELQRLLARRAQMEPAWSQLFSDVRLSMAQAIPPDAPQAQPLAKQWLGLMLDWMDGDFETMDRWGKMYRLGSVIDGGENPSAEMVKYITTVIDYRKAAFLRHMSIDELKQVRPLSAKKWSLLAKDIEALKVRKQSPSSRAAKAVVNRWAVMTLEQVGYQRKVLDKMLMAIRVEHLLQATAGNEAVARDFLRQAIRAQGDPFSDPPVAAQYRQRPTS